MTQNFITKDAASKINKDIFEDISKELLAFFKFKENTSVYQNFIDEFFNPIHFAIVFELPKLAKNNKIISSIDNKKFAVMVSNDKFTDSNKKLQTVYENRIAILKNIFEWEIIDIEEEVWKILKGDEKKNFLKLKFGFEFLSIEDSKVKILETEDKEFNKENIKEDKKQPKYNLTKNLFNKKNKF